MAVRWPGSGPWGRELPLSSLFFASLPCPAPTRLSRHPLTPRGSPEPTFACSTHTTPPCRWPRVGERMISSCISHHGATRFATHPHTSTALAPPHSFLPSRYLRARRRKYSPETRARSGWRLPPLHCLFLLSLCTLSTPRTRNTPLTRFPGILPAGAPPPSSTSSRTSSSPELRWGAIAAAAATPAPLRARVTASTSRHCPKSPLGELSPSRARPRVACVREREERKTTRQDRRSPDRRLPLNADGSRARAARAHRHGPLRP